MKTIFYQAFVVIMLLLSQVLMAEEMESPTGEIAGKVVTNEKSEPVSYASVALLKSSDSTIITGVISEEDGTFLLKNIPYGKYMLKVSFVGYKPLVLEKLELSRKNKKISLEALRLEENVTKLDEAVVVEERLKGEEKIDRTTFTINDDIRKTSSSGLDLLKHIPSVSVDFQDNVTLEGESNIQFYVDGIMRNKEFVSQLDPELIDKVELLTNPGVKYNADVSGVINIVLKKVKRYGVNGSFLLPVPHPKKILANPRANIEYGNQNFRIYAGERMHFEKFHGTENLFTQVNNVDKPFEYVKESEGDFSFRHNYMNYGIDWFINEKTTLNFLGEWRSNKFIKDDFSENSVTEDGQLTDFFETNRYNVETGNNHYFSLFFKHQFDKEGSEITSEAYVYMHDSETENEYTDMYCDIQDLETVLNTADRNDFTLNASKTFEYRLDYTFLTNKVKHETGLREYTQWMNNDFSDIYNLETITNEKSSNFQYNEHRQAAYYNVLGKIRKIDWQAGIRGEYSNLNINDSTKTDYFVFLPQFSLSRKIEKNQSLKFTYRRQIRRPSARNLNPFITWTDSLHRRIGNQNLKPSYENQLELTYAKNIGSNYLSPKLFFNYSKDRIQDLSEIDPVTGVTTITQANIGKDMEYGARLNASVQIFKWWKINGNISIYDKIIESDQNLAIEKNNQKVTYSIGGNAVFKLPKDFNLFGFWYYRSPEISYQREHYRDFLFIMGLEKTLFEDVKIEAYYNPFIKYFTYSGVTTRSPGYYEDWNGKLDVRQLFGIEISYRFNYGGKVKKLKRNADYEQESSGGAL
jgi:outer membrane receptor protein involved in Fe transport